MEYSKEILENTELDIKQEQREDREDQERKKAESRQKQKELNTIIGKNIHKLRGSHSQQYVADVLGIHRTFLGRLECGKFESISTLLLKNIADHFNVPIDTLFNSGA